MPNGRWKDIKYVSQNENNLGRGNNEEKDQILFLRINIIKQFSFALYLNRQENGRQENGRQENGLHTQIIGRILRLTCTCAQPCINTHFALHRD